MKDCISKGMALANKRNELIIKKSLKYEVIWGDDSEWSWYYHLPKETCTETTYAIQMGFNACSLMSVDPKSALETAFGYPLAAIGGVLDNLAHFCRRTCGTCVPSAYCKARHR